jgi:DNA-binding CsgD family transcriptional regulator
MIAITITIDGQLATVAAASQAPQPGATTAGSEPSQPVATVASQAPSFQPGATIEIKPATDLAIPITSALTPAELRVLPWLAAGLTGNAIARSIGISPRTVRTHVHRAGEKTYTQGSTMLAVYALLTGIVTPAEILAIWRDRYPELFGE